ncbi:hypothetical protein Cni_G23772 [Canna indica]|uniref:Protein kinase domain-containing protein n=1 Tax=Canna indica TaxID=4628 RepID=A0AAQ3QJH4_9LILI|nr:hypothetical protein Cni_G23772 [Canna indica]
MAFNSYANLGDVRRFAQLVDEMLQFGVEPNVLAYNVLIKILSATTSGLCYNLFLEYVARGLLSDDIAKHGGHLDEVTIRLNTCDILRGLAYLHTNGVVHCNVKGQNVLVGSDSHAKST